MRKLKEQIQSLQNLLDFYKFSNNELRQTVIQQNNIINELKNK